VDGYQSPAGSSSGSGAAIAAYLWLDISIGSDSKPTLSLLVCSFHADLRKQAEVDDSQVPGMAVLLCGQHMAYILIMVLF
jgi:hypothetical protein